jgi:hypothetical protein
MIFTLDLLAYGTKLAKRKVVLRYNPGEPIPRHVKTGLARFGQFRT